MSWRRTTSRAAALREERQAAPPMPSGGKDNDHEFDNDEPSAMPGGLNKVYDPQRHHLIRSHKMSQKTSPRNKIATSFRDNEPMPRVDSGAGASQYSEVQASASSDGDPMFTPRSNTTRSIDDFQAAVIRRLVCEEVRDLLKEERRETRDLFRVELDHALARCTETVMARSKSAHSFDISPPTSPKASVIHHNKPPAPDEDSVSAKHDIENLREDDSMGCEPEPIPYADEPNKNFRAEASVNMKSLIVGEDEDHEDDGDPTSVGEAISQLIPCVGRCVIRLEQCFALLGELEAPPKKDYVSRFVDSALFTLIMYTIILTNIGFMVYSANEDVQNYLEESSEIVKTSETVFLVLYSIEFVLKFHRHGKYYFVDSNWYFNWSDFFLLICLYSLMLLDSIAPNLYALRMLRIFRLARALRVVHLIKKFKSLRAIMKSLVSTIGTLAWSLVMLTVILFMFALVFVLLVGTYFKAEGENLGADEEAELTQAFGTVWIALVNLYMCVTSGDDWTVFYSAMKHTGLVNEMLFLLFIAFTQIAVLNIILGLFVDQAMTSLANEKAEAAYEHAVSEKQTERELKALCKTVDTSGDGEISIQEWEEVLKMPNMKSYLKLMGFRPQNMKQIFTILSQESEDKTVAIDMFVRGCMKLKGAASCFDTQVLALELKELGRLLQDQRTPGPMRTGPPSISGSASCRSAPTPRRRA